MAATNDDDGEIISSINVTPLVDIMLVLLIIFMLTATIIASSSIKVDLPKAATGEATEVSVLGITITANSTLYLNEKETSELGLYNFALEQVKAKTDLQALIAADRGVSYGKVIRVIDLIKRAGVTRFALNIDSEASLPGEESAGPALGSSVEVKAATSP